MIDELYDLSSREIVSLDRAPSFPRARPECGPETASQNTIQTCDVGVGSHPLAEGRREGWGTQNWGTQCSRRQILPRHVPSQTAPANPLQVSTLQLTHLDGIFYDKRLVFNIL